MWFLLLLLSLVLLMVGAKSRNKQRPPGPLQLPFLGNFHQLGSHPHRSLWRLSKKYGPVMFLRLGSVPTVVISSAEAARQVLKVHDLDCCSRPSLAGPRRLSYDYLDMAFTPYGQYWREMRKLCLLELLSVKRVQEFHHVREEEIAAMVNSIAQSSSVNLREEIFSVAISIVFKTAFGKAFDGSEFDKRRLHEVVEEADAMLGSFFASDFFPYVGWILDRFSGLHTRLERCFNELDGFFQHVIDEHLNPSRNKQEHEDIVDVLLRVEREQKECGAQFTKDHIKANLMNIFLAGVTPGAFTIIWAMSELARKPRLMLKAQDEVRGIVGKQGKVTERDIDELQYLKMIVKETLRLHPAVPLLIPREAMSRFKVNGYDVYPKTRIEVNAWAIGRDPNQWNNPEEFSPERFADSSFDFKGNHFEYLPFGAGRRGCPGLYMGTTIVELTLANLLYCFDWKLPGGMKEEDIDMEEAPGTISSPKTSALKLVPIKYQWS